MNLESGTALALQKLQEIRECKTASGLDALQQRFAMGDVIVKEEMNGGKEMDL